MGEKIYVFLILQRKQKGALVVFADKEKRAYCLTIRHTSYLYLIIGKKMQPLFYVLQIPLPLTPRKDKTGRNNRKLLSRLRD